MREGVLDDKFIIGFQESGVDPLEPLVLGERDPCDMSMDPWDSPSRREEISDKPRRLFEDALEDVWEESKDPEKLENWLE